MGIRKLVLKSNLFHPRTLVHLLLLHQRNTLPVVSWPPLLETHLMQGASPYLENLSTVIPLLDLKGSPGDHHIWLEPVTDPEIVTSGGMVIFIK